jgi:ligand-binding SRPBCC domain-containing protein
MTYVCVNDQRLETNHWSRFKSEIRDHVLMDHISDAIKSHLTRFIGQQLKSPLSRTQFLRRSRFNVDAYNARNRPFTVAQLQAGLPDFSWCVILKPEKCTK